MIRFFVINTKSIRIGFNRKLKLLIIGTPFLLFSSCGDLELEMQDTRSIVLKMNFDQRSSSRSSQISQAALSNHKTHLILAVPAWVNLSRNYINFYSNFFAVELMNPYENKVSLDIPLNTQIKIFAFIFLDEYSPDRLVTGVDGIAYYGESQPFYIDTNTSNLRLGINLQSASTPEGQDEEEENIGNSDYENEGYDENDDHAGNDSQSESQQSIVVYETTTPTRLGSNIVYSTDNSSYYSNSDLQADGVKIGYRMEVTYNGTDYYAEIFFDAWDGITLSSLLFPTVLNGNVIQVTVDNMSVTSNYPTVINTSSTTGRLEIWPYNYSTSANSGIGGSSLKYDFDDTHTGTSSYGSMQIHNLTDAQTVIAWNRHGSSNPDIGLGNNPNLSGHSDWTFSGASSLGSLNWKFQILFRR